MTLYSILLYLHVAVGVVALLAFWGAALVRKGSLLHRRIGKVYLLAMFGILITAVPMAIHFLLQERISVGVFFIYLVVITATSCWLAPRAIQLKSAPQAYFNRRYGMVAGTNIVSGLLVFAIGVNRSDYLLMGFCWIGVITGIGMLRTLRRAPRPRNWWLKEHYGAMLGNGVATHVAFLAIGLGGFIRDLGIPMLQLVPWFLPLSIALVVGIVLDRRYARPLPF
jgi:hypothetical protein